MILAHLSIIFGTLFVLFAVRIAMFKGCVVYSNFFKLTNFIAYVCVYIMAIVLSKEFFYTWLISLIIFITGFIYFWIEEYIWIGKLRC